MDNPLSEEQIRKINEIAKLPKEKQQVELQKFLGTLNNEQIEFLKKNWGKEQECIFCSIIEGGVKSYKIYENAKYLAVLDINPVNEGHCLIIPKNHVKFITDIDNDIFDVIKKIVNKIYSVYNCDCNILINNGANAGQKIEHFSISIIPRYKDDEFSINAKTKKIEDEEMLLISKKLFIFDEIKIEEHFNKIEEGPEITEDYFEEMRMP